MGKKSGTEGYRRMGQGCKSGRTIMKHEQGENGALTGRSLTLVTYHLGKRDGAVVRALTSHQCGLGWSPVVYAICGFSLLLGLVLASKVFRQVLRFSSFPQKLTFLNSNLTWMKCHSMDMPLKIPIYINLSLLLLLLLLLLLIVLFTTIWREVYME